jgi:hypothetical protein
MLYLQRILFITKPDILQLELETISGYKINKEEYSDSGKTSGEKFSKKLLNTVDK